MRLHRNKWQNRRRLTPAKARFFRPRAELLESRTLLTHGVLVEDFQLDSDPAQGGFAGSVFEHSRADDAIYDYLIAGINEGPTSLRHGLVALISSESDIITFPGQEVDFVSVAVNAAQQWDGGTAAVQFVGVNGTVTYRPPSTGAFPPLDPLGWLPSTLEIGLLPVAGTPDWVVVDSNPYGLDIGPIIEVRLGGDTTFFDDLTIHAVPVAPPPPPNQQPDAVDDQALAASGDPLDIAVLANDTDPDQGPLTIIAVSATSNPGGSAVLNGNFIRYISALGFRGTDSFTYTIDDGHGGQDTATVLVTVALGNDIYIEDFSSDANAGNPGFDPRGVFQHHMTINSSPLPPYSIDPNQPLLPTPPPPPPSSAVTALQGSGYSVQDFGGDHVLWLFNAFDQITIHTETSQSVEFASVERQAFSEGRVEFIGTSGIYSVPFAATGQHPQTVSVGAGHILPSGLEIGSIQRIDLFGYEVVFDRVLALIVGAPSNQPPQAQDDSAITLPGVAVAIHVLANDSDPNGDRLLIAGGVSGFHGVVTSDPEQPNILIYTPNAGFHGIDTFTYDVQDDEGSRSTATVIVTVNTPPVAIQDDYVLPHGYVGSFQTDFAVRLLANDSDPDGDPLAVVDVTDGLYGSVNWNADGTFVYTPYAVGVRLVDDVFSYGITDGYETSRARVLIRIENDTPVAGDARWHPNHFQTGIETFSAAYEDPDGDSITAIVVDPPTVGTIERLRTVLSDTGVTYVEFDYRPFDGVFGMNDRFTYKVNDGYADSNVASVEIIVQNEVPVAHDDPRILVPGQFGQVDDTVWIDEFGYVVPSYYAGRNIRIDGIASPLHNDFDADGDTLQAVLVDGPANGSVNLEPDGAFTYLPAPDFIGTDRFTYRVTDGFLNSNVAEVRIHVVPPPQIEGWLRGHFADSRPLHIGEYVYVPSVTEIGASILHLADDDLADDLLLQQRDSNGHFVDSPLQLIVDASHVDYADLRRYITIHFRNEGQHIDSLLEGDYRLFFSGRLQGWFYDLELDGNGDGVPGDDAAYHFTVLFGDHDGDGVRDGQASPSWEYRTDTLIPVGEGSTGIPRLDAAPGTSIYEARLMGNPSPSDTPAGAQFPLGFFEFQVVGLPLQGSTTVTLTVPDVTQFNTYYKYGPEPANPDTVEAEEIPHWYEFLYDGYTGAEINGNIITLHFIDGARGDDNASRIEGVRGSNFFPDGVITDPGGPALVIPQLTMVGASSTNEAELYALTLAASGLGSDLVTGWTINWGDGTTSTAMGAQAAAEHRYDDGPRNFTISATAQVGSLSVPADNTIDVTVENVSPTATFNSAGPAPAGTRAVVSFSSPFDPSTADTAAGFTYSFDFNLDGDYSDPGELDGVTAASAAAPLQPRGTYLARGRITDKDGGYRDYETTYEVLPAAGIESVVINDGHAQRSMVSSITVTFAGLVTIQPGAFELWKVGASRPGTPYVALADIGGRTVARLTFHGPGVPGGSLADGDYRLLIKSSKIRNSDGSPLDGNGDGLPGGDRVDEFFRRFGDTDGDDDVDRIDADVFGRAFGKRSHQPGYLWYLDYNASGHIWAEDLALFLLGYARSALRR